MQDETGPREESNGSGEGTHRRRRFDRDCGGRGYSTPSRRTNQFVIRVADIAGFQAKYEKRGFLNPHQDAGEIKSNKKACGP